MEQKHKALHEKEIWDRLGIQDYLALGYLYLLLLGITSDSIFYGLLGINIISYSSILDVLLSPIVHLTGSIAFPVTIILLPALLYGYLLLIKKISAKSGDSDKKNPFSTRASFMKIWVLVCTTAIFSAYMGFGIGGGVKKLELLNSGKLKTNHQLQYTNNEMVDVHVLGNNSEYIFYVVTGEKTMRVTPIKQQIRAVIKK